MSVVDLISGTIIIIKGAYLLTVAIDDSENLHKELKETAKRVAIVLKIVEEVIGQLGNLAHRVSGDAEAFIISSTNSVKLLVIDIEHILRDVQEDRNFIQRFLMNKDGYQHRLLNSTNDLNQACQRIQAAIPGLSLIPISREEMPNIRKLFANSPEKEHLVFDFCIVKDTPRTVSTIALEEFDPTKCFCFVKVGSDRLFVSYRLRTWVTAMPKAPILEERRKKFVKPWPNISSPDLAGSNSSLNSLSSAHSVPIAAADITIDVIRKELDFSQFWMSSDDVCGIAMTQSTIYVATKHEVTAVSLSRQKAIAQYGREGDGPNMFKRISYIYIHTLPTGESNLYILDGGQNVVHQYKIDDSGQHFKYVRQYVVIANVGQPYNLKSCVIFNNYLYISDSTNHCLHSFPLQGERQSFYLISASKTPFSPGALCAVGNYLYVADCSIENPSILILNEECEPVDCFRNKSLQQILAIDIDPNMNELFVLTTKTKQGEKNEAKKQPLIVSMDRFIRSRN